jgi:predicted metal-binding protein
VYDKDVDVLELFEKTRRELGTELINQCELPYKQALIAGHCFICEFCTRKCGETCTYPDQLKYSLESLGFSVGDISKDLLGISIKWHTEKGEPTVLVAIGAILSKN